MELSGTVLLCSAGNLSCEPSCYDCPFNNPVFWNFFPPQAVLMSTAPAPMMLFFKAWLAVILLLTLLCLIQTDHRVVKMMTTAALWMEQLMVAHGTVSQEVSPPQRGPCHWLL